jgi:hypothetical protein
MFPTTTAFTQSDWSLKEVREKLHVVTMSKLNKYPLTAFNTLSTKEKRIANEILNEYIRKFPEKGWEDKLTADFNLVCIEEIFDNPKIDFTTLPIKQKDLADYPVDETEMVKRLE